MLHIRNRTMRIRIKKVEEVLLEASVFVYDSDGTIQRFIGMINEYIAGIIVDGNFRSQGIGTQLLLAQNS